jgi:hypothetical protein
MPFWDGIVCPISSTRLPLTVVTPSIVSDAPPAVTLTDEASRTDGFQLMPTIEHIDIVLRRAVLGGRRIGKTRDPLPVQRDRSSGAVCWSSRWRSAGSRHHARP